MAFTYVDDLSTNRDKVRFSIRDTTEDSGPRPGGANFSDAEIAGLISIEGTWRRAVTAAFDTLAAEWSKYADVAAGPHRESLSQIAKSYRQQADEWRGRKLAEFEVF